MSNPSGSTNTRASGSTRPPLFPCFRMERLLKESEDRDLAPLRTKRASTYKIWDPLMGQPNVEGYQEAKDASDLASAECRDEVAKQSSKPYSSEAHFTAHFLNGRWAHKDCPWPLNDLPSDLVNKYRYEHYGLSPPAESAMDTRSQLTATGNEPERSGDGEEED